MKRIVCAVLLLLAGHANALAGEEAPAISLIDEEVISIMKSWLENPIVEISIDAQNQKHAGLNNAAIEELDLQWRAERRANDQPLIAATLSNPLSSYLTQIQAASLGLYAEVFVMDSHGLNVGQSSVTTDYWQGDEAKFKQTYLVSPNAVFIDKPEYDAVSRTWRAQVNMTISRASRPIGAVTVEYNLSELARRRAE